MTHEEYGKLCELFEQGKKTEVIKCNGLEYIDWVMVCPPQYSSAKEHDWRLVDPYRIFKDAIASGKNVQYKSLSGRWYNSKPGKPWQFDCAPERYRIFEEVKRISVFCVYEDRYGAPLNLVKIFSTAESADKWCSTNRHMFSTHYQIKEIPLEV